MSGRLLDTPNLGGMFMPLCSVDLHGDGMFTPASHTPLYMWGETHVNEGVVIYGYLHYDSMERRKSRTSKPHGAA